MFKDDNTIVHFRKPHSKLPRNQLIDFLVQFSVRENLLVVTGSPETKQLGEMLPDIIKQVGPQQYEALKNMMGNLSKDPKAAQADADDEDDVPPLVQGTFEDAAKK